MSTVVSVAGSAVQRRARRAKAVAALVSIACAALTVTSALAKVADKDAPPPGLVDPPTPVRRPAPAPRSASQAQPEAQAQRLARINAAKSWGYQLNGLSVEEAAASPYDLLVVDATTGLRSGKPFTREEVERLKRKPDGSRRIVASYLSVGEAEDYRPDYFTPEYMTEDAPDWLLQENKDWKGNRLIRFCHQGWQLTILGDEDGRNVYNSIEPSPLYRLVELGFDGIYLDRVDVYSEIARECPDGARKMVDFIARLGAHARKRNPQFMVILQNAEELLEHKTMMTTIDAVAREGLFHSWSRDEGGNRDSVRLLQSAKAAGRGVFVVDYPSSRGKAETSVRKIQALGFVPYIAPKDLNQLWLPGRNF